MTTTPFLRNETTEAINQLQARRDALLDILGAKTTMVPAGLGNGSGAILLALNEIERTMALLIVKDLTRNTMTITEA